MEQTLIDTLGDELYRALVSREAVAPLPFTDARAAFVRELLFGGASEAARPALAPVVVRALLARSAGCCCVPVPAGN